MTEYAVRTEMVQKVYGKQKALNQISIHIEQGSIYGLIGRNGAGKTTLMKLIAGLAYPTSGDIYLYGEDTIVSYTSEFVASGFALIMMGIFMSILSCSEHDSGFLKILHPAASINGRLLLPEAYRRVCMHLCYW